MNQYTVALSIDKIQAFLTEVIHSHVQEKQTEDATLRGIVDSSYEISNGFFKVIKDEFKNTIKPEDMLLECSGVYIFRSSLTKLEIENHLDSLFIRYYKESQGQKLIRWTYFVSSSDSDVEDIDIKDVMRAKQELKKANGWNKIIEKNQSLLFSFCPVQEIKSRKNDVDEKQEEFTVYADDINALYKKVNEEDEDKKRFRIAVIKADLDGMGAMFKKIKKYKDYQNISQILNEELCLEGLHKAVVDCTPKGKGKWLFPLYIAGDDIFFAVAIEDVIHGVNVCRKIMESVNQKIQESGNSTKLALSIGIDITYNRQPIRYYMEMVEKQLKNAKSKKVPKDLEEYFIIKLSIGNLTFFDVDYKMIKTKKNTLSKKEKTKFNQLLQEYPIWNFFLNDLKVLNYIRQDSDCSDVLGKPNFFYTLLEDITSSEVQNNNVRYINHVLYRLLPTHFEDSNKKLQKMELLLNSSLIKQLCINGKGGALTEIDKATKQRFESYLRLMIFFCDERFNIVTENDYKNFENKIDKESEKRLQGYLLTKPREHLYKVCISENEVLTRIFVEYKKIIIDKLTNKIISEQEYKMLKNKKNIIIKAGYKKLILESSSFFRLRKISCNDIDKAVKIIELRNPSTDEAKDEINRINKERKDAKKLANRMIFKKDEFRSIIKGNPNLWNPDFVDSIMLFYQYNELVMNSKREDKNKG